MSSLDQAFIKAYMQQEAVAAAWQPSASPIAVGLYQDASVAEPQKPAATATAVAEAEPEPADEYRAARRTSLPPLPAEPIVSAAPIAEEPFMPMLQVDRVAWPTAVTKMGSAVGQTLDQIVDRLIVNLARGRKVIAMQGLRRGDGCTTLLLAVGRRLAQRGIDATLFDADTDNPRLARRLGLAPECGWEAVLSGRLPLAEVVVQSLEDRLAVVPYCEPSPEEERKLAGRANPASMLTVLRGACDVVLVDLGRAERRSRVNPAAMETLGSWLDAAILVQNVRTTGPVELAQAYQRLQTAGVTDVTVVENFADHV